MGNYVPRVWKYMLNAKGRFYLFANGCHPFESVSRSYGYSKAGFVSMATSIFVILFILISPFTIKATNGSFGGGTGSVSDPLIIQDPADLNAVRNGLNLHYKLGNDIDVTSYLDPSGPGGVAWGIKGWLPIGNSSTPFTGSLDGAGKKITKLWMGRNDENGVGLFGYASDAVIKNLVFEFSTIQGGNYTGGLVGWFAASSTNVGITDCYVKGTVSSIGNCCGGLVGRQFANHSCSNVIQRCCFDGTTGGGSYTGAIVGQQATSSGGVCTITNCFASGIVEGSTHTGGIAGYQNAGTSVSAEAGGSIFITDCYSTASVSGTRYVGGIAGYQEARWGSVTIGNCYTTGTLSASNNTLGGIVGHQSASNSNNNSVFNCFATGDLSCGSLCGGIVGNQETNTGGVNTIDNNLRYQLAKVNGIEIPPGGENRRDGRHGEATTSAIDFMTQATYSGNGWSFGSSWYWSGERYPMLNFGPEKYPFPFYAIDYNLDGGTMPAGTQYSYVPGVAFTLPIPTKTQYDFDGWFDNGLNLVTDILSTDLGHKEFWAQWTKVIFDITVLPTSNGSVISDKSVAIANETVTLTLTPNTGCELTSLTVYQTGNPYVTVTVTSGAGNTYTFDVINFDVTVEAVFTAINYSISVLVDGGTGGVASANKTVANYGEVITLTVTPDLGYVFTSILAYQTGNEAFVVPLTAVTNDTYTFTMPTHHVTVKVVFTPVYYSITTQVDGRGGQISAKTQAIEGETITVTLSPDTNYEVNWIRAFKTGGPIVIVPVTGAGNTRTFTMPAFDVTVQVNFHDPVYQTAWAAAKIIIENADFSVLQEDANTLADLRNKIADLINDLIAGTGFVITPYDIVIFNFNSAQTGTANNTRGVNGLFEFRVTPPETTSSAYNDGTIIATPYDPTINEQIARFAEPQLSALTAWAQNGMLYVNGLSEGQTWSVYNLTGSLIYQGIASGNEATIAIPSRGVYVIRVMDKAIKVMY